MVQGPLGPLVRDMLMADAVLAMDTLLVLEDLAEAEVVARSLRARGVPVLDVADEAAGLSLPHPREPDRPT